MSAAEVLAKSTPITHAAIINPPVTASRNSSRDPTTDRATRITAIPVPSSIRHRPV
ncbi:hypothetical protein GCM10010483_56430 [Actinokineospora diospyrosa]